jgi:hypothetical protein
LQMAGWRVARITWHQLHSEQDRVMCDLKTLLAIEPYVEANIGAKRRSHPSGFRKRRSAGGR